MNILKYIYKGGIMAALFTIAACSADTFTAGESTPGDTPIVVTGTLTRATGNTETGEKQPLIGYTNLKLSAKTNNNTFYFQDQDIVLDGASSNANQTKLKTSVRYPVGNQPIYLFAHTGKLDANGQLPLTSGQATTNDILLSNGEASDEGKGTKGSSDANADLLTFHHVMTKVDVKIVIDDAEMQKPEPSNISIKFGARVAAKGTFDITSSQSSSTATAAGGDQGYALKQGVNYLVPTGVQLSEQQNIITELKIDDYIATEADRKKLTIPAATMGGGTTTNDLILKPGLSYQLTFKIKRLKVEEIILTMKEWDIEKGEGAWGCDPYKVKMDFSGGYNNNGTNAISKMVFHYTPEASPSNSYQYIAGVKEGIAEFLTLPADMTTGALTADLYTANGLLIQNHTISYTAATTGSDLQKFNIDLGANGMVKDGNDYYEVGTPLQFYNLMSNPGKDNDAADEKKYKLIQNIDISHLPLALTTSVFPEGGILDGDGHSILHLEQKGNGLFSENKGTLKQLHLAFSTIDATKSSVTYAGGLCAINSGRIEGCINEADVTGTGSQSVGGICGKNTGTILACLNTGNIPSGAEIGGICGENASGSADAIKACINAGMLHGSSNHQQTSNIGGICGYQSVTKEGNAVINTCYWLTGTARPVQGNSEEISVGRFPEGESGSSYCNSTTNMTETKLRTEAITELNKALGTSADWKFEWEEISNGTYKTVWPIPVKNSNP